MCLINHAKDRVEILKEAFHKTYRDPNFTRNTRNSPTKNPRRSCPKIMRGDQRNSFRA